MRRLFGLLLVIVVVGGVVAYLLTKDSKQAPNNNETVVIDETGYEATPEAFMSKIKNEIDNLDNREEYKIAYTLIDDCLGKHYSLKNLQYAVEHAEKHLASLKKHNSTNELSIFHEPKITDSETAKKVLKDMGISIGTNTLPLGGLGKIIANVASIATVWKTLNDIDKANFLRADAQEFVLVKKEQSAKILSQYEIIQDSLKTYIVFLTKSYPIDDNDVIKQEYFSIRDKVELLRRELIDARCNYVSYRIISPALAKVSKEHYLATFKWLGLDDKSKLRNSIIELTHSFHNEWLFTSTEEVRIQYCDVVKSLKNDVGKAEWEEFKTLSTMLDSNDPSKPRGADAWWR